MKFKNIFFIALLFLFLSCNKEESAMVIEAEPSIELVKITPESGNIQQYVDEVVFTIKYYDGDGDLGTNDPDIPSIEVIDTRNPEILIFKYHLSPRTPAGSEIIITGELNVVLDHTILIDENNPSEKTTFKIRIKDRAGNWSNEVETEELTIVQ